MSWFSSSLKSVVGEQRYEQLSDLFVSGITEKLTGLKVVQPFVEQAEQQRLADMKTQYLPFLYIAGGIAVFYLVVKKL